MKLNKAVAIASPILSIFYILGHAIALYPSILLFRLMYNGDFSFLLAIELTLAFILTFPTLLLLVWAMIFRLLPKPDLGEILNTQNAFKNILLVGIGYFAKVTFSRMTLSFIPFPGMLFYKICGSKIHPSVFLSGPDCIADPYLISIGKGSIIGQGAIISGHFQPSASKTVLGRVDIGQNVLIGVNTFILPNVKIGDNARVLAQSVVTPGTIIGPGETWQGVPAQKIK